jgi:hypothetical protein
VQKHVFFEGEEISKFPPSAAFAKLHTQPETVIVVVQLILKLSKRSLKAQHKTQSERDLQKKPPIYFQLNREAEKNREACVSSFISRNLFSGVNFAVVICDKHMWLRIKHFAFLFSGLVHIRSFC